MGWIITLIRNLCVRDTSAAESADEKVTFEGVFAL